jgi:purine-binding chemotaxis protein CheW
MSREAERMTSETIATAVAPERTPSATAKSGADETGPASWLLCRAGNCLCALPLEHVVEIMRVLPIEAISGAPRYVRGLCIIRGSPTPVVDTALLIGDAVTRPERLVTIRTGGRIVALAMEAVLGIRMIDAQAGGQLPPLLRDAARDTITSIGTLDAALLFFLRAARVIPDDVLEHLDAGGAMP